MQGRTPSDQVLQALGTPLKKATAYSYKESNKSSQKEIITSDLDDRSRRWMTLKMAAMNSS